MAASRYRALVDTFTVQIRSGQLPPGTRLPTHRALARREGIAIATATRVYAELADAALVSREPGRGTFVREWHLPIGHGIDQQPTPDGVLDLNFNYPRVPEQAARLRETLRDIAAAGDIDTLLRYQPHGGRAQDRAALVHHLSARELHVPDRQVLVVNGAQHGLATALLSLLRPGDSIAVDAVTYPGLVVLADTLGLHCVPIPVTATGPDLDALDRASHEHRIKAVYTMPTMHNPLSWIMSDADRDRLVTIARRHDQLLIEDSSYAFLATDAPTPVLTRAPERTVHVGGFAKSVATGLRVGYLLAPDRFVSRLERTIRATIWNTPALPAAIVTTWLRDGTVDELERLKRHDAARRQVISSQALDGLPTITHPNSYLVWLPLPPDARADRITTTLSEQHNIAVATATPFTTTTHRPQALRLALGSVETHQIEPALRTVARTVALDATC